MKTLQRIAICLILGVMLVVALPTQASPWIYVYPLPGYGNITDFTVDRNGSAWVVDNANHAIYEVMFGKYGQYTYNFRQPNSHWPLGITEGPGGIMWFTDEIANQIILISQYGGTNAYSLGQTCSPKYIVADGDGNLWFTNYRCPQLGRITTLGVIQMFPADYGSELTRDDSGNLWFEIYTGTETVKIGKYTIASGEFTAYTIPAAAAPNGISSLTYGSDGSLWFTGVRQSITRMSSTGEVTSFTTPVDNDIRGITRGTNGNMWFTTGDSIYSVTTGGSFVTVANLEAGTKPSIMRTDAKGLVWFLEDGAKSAARIDPLNSQYLFFPRVNSVPLVTATPYPVRPTATPIFTSIPTRTPTRTSTRTPTLRLR